MKRIIICVLCFISVSLFGCSLSFQDEREKQEQMLEEAVTEIIVKRQGIIEEKRIKLYEEGTHYLDQEIGGRILLKSKIVGLNEYVEKEVVVRGTLKKTFENEDIIDVIEVTKVKEKEKVDGVYKGKYLKVAFKKPKELTVFEDKNGIILKREDTAIIEIVITETKQEELDGAPAVVNGMEAQKITKDDGGIKIYVYPDKERAYLLKYAPIDDENKEENKSFYFALLNSFEVKKAASDESSGEKCGGEENIKCKEGYYCELLSEKDKSEGVCKPTEALIDKPVLFSDDDDDNDDDNDNDDNNDNDDDKFDDYEDEDGLSKSEERVKAYISEKIQGFIPDEEIEGDISITQFVFSEPDIVSVIYIKGEEQRKITFTYTIDSDLGDVKLTQEAYFKPGETTDWVLEEGENLQAGKAKKVIGENENVNYIPEGYSLFSYSRYNYSTSYPKSWYYASFAGDGADVISKSIFSDESVDSGVNDLVTIDVLKKSLEKLNKSHLSEEESGNQLRIYVEKNDEQSFVIYGAKEYEDVMRVMAENLGEIEVIK